jgi:Ca2+-binding EF-hand superfamily protein
MTALDVDKDGQLSAKEIKNASAALLKLDKNEDGKLTPDELRPQFAGPGGPGHGGPGFERPGPGGRGFGGPRPDGDRPQPPQADGHPPAQDMIQRLMNMDADGDGKITKEEMPERMRGMLERIDTNGDGAIDKEEAEKMAQRFGQGARQRGDRPAAGERGDRPRRPQRPAQE